MTTDPPLPESVVLTISPEVAPLSMLHSVTVVSTYSAGVGVAVMTVVDPTSRTSGESMVISLICAAQTSTTRRSTMPMGAPNVAIV